MALIKSTEFISKKNKKIIIRCLGVEEDESLYHAVVDIVSKSPYVISTAQDFVDKGVKAQTEMIKKSNDNERMIFLIAEFENKIIGICNFTAYHAKKTRHRGEFGLSLSEDFRGEGIGKELMKVLLDFCKGVKDLQRLELSVMSANTPAIELYNNFGFKKVNSNPGAYILSDGSETDNILMSLDLR